MAGTTGLEPATSAVTALRFEVFQRLTNPWGTPKTTEAIEDRAFCGSDCGSGFSPFLRFLVGERVALLAAIEPRATCPERRLERSRWRGGHCLDAEL